MHLAKALEFRAVAVMVCDDEIIPLQSRIEAVTEDSDLEEVYNTERHLLYVACTRARDHLLITSVEPTSEFLDDFQAERAQELGEAKRRSGISHTAGHVTCVFRSKPITDSGPSRSLIPVEPNHFSAWHRNRALSPI